MLSRATPHYIVYAWAVIFVVIGFIMLLGGSDTAPASVTFFLIALFVGLVAHIRVKTSEFAVTNKRVLIKVGVVSRRSLELLLAKIEGIGVNQSITGRLLDYGTIVVSGTGGTKEPFKIIAKPLAFRKCVQEQISVPQAPEPVRFAAGR